MRCGCEPLATSFNERFDEALRATRRKVDVIYHRRERRFRQEYDLRGPFDAAIDRLGDWRWNEGYDPYNPPLRPDPRKARAALRGGQKGEGR